MNKQKWYVLYTSPRAEKKVDERLKDAGYESYLPLHYAPRRWSDRVKMVEVPLFSSYIFIYTYEYNLRSLLEIQGLYRVVYHNGAPAVIRKSVIDNIKKFLELAREKEVTYGLGDEVLIACGPLKDVEGKIVRMRKGEYCLFIPELGHTVRISPDKVLKNKLKITV